MDIPTLINRHIIAHHLPQQRIFLRNGITAPYAEGQVGVNTVVVQGMMNTPETKDVVSVVEQADAQVAMVREDIRYNLD